MRPPKVYVIIPAYNEQDFLENAVDSVIRVLARSEISDYTILIAEDGSTDGSDVICMKLSRKYSRVLCIHSKRRLGKGGAIKRSIRNLPNTGIMIHLDVDLSVPPEYIPLAVKHITETGCDSVICSRLRPGSTVNRSLYRQILSIGYNLLVNVLFRTGITDHQCGFKAFNLETTRDSLLEAQDSGWFWDTEILVRLKRKGLKVCELPVVWNESERDSRLNLKRDIIEMFISLLRFRFGAPRFSKRKS
ncbi:glycosyltransferase [Thermococcus camini]|uniref:Glycosyl transferase family 2 n=1 Tax=Thermococcus camini TaxID=2016373 RepID=A0A7G2D773_9EURY